MPCSLVTFVLLNNLQLNHEHVYHQQPTAGESWRMKREGGTEYSGTKREKYTLLTPIKQLLKHSLLFGNELLKSNASRHIVNSRWCGGLFLVSQ